MTRSEFILATALILFVAFVLGWFASWLLHRLSRVSHADLGELDRMAQALHEAEEARDQAIAYLQDREAEMSSRLHQTEAELREIAGDLRESRHEATELRDYVDRMRRKA